MNTSIESVKNNQRNEKCKTGQYWWKYKVTILFNDVQCPMFLIYIKVSYGKAHGSW